jgi:hypothetical protein
MIRNTRDFFEHKYSQIDALIRGDEEITKKACECCGCEEERGMGDDDTFVGKVRVVHPGDVFDSLSDEDKDRLKEIMEEAGDTLESVMEDIDGGGEKEPDEESVEGSKEQPQMKAS